MRKLSDAKVEEMFAAYTEKQTLRYVSRKCNVALQTVNRYRKLDSWDERIAKIQRKTIEKVNTVIVNKRARQAKYGELMSAIGARRLQNIIEQGTVNIDIDGRLAKDLIKDGVTIEREALGDYTPDIVIRLDLPDDIDL